MTIKYMRAEQFYDAILELVKRGVGFDSVVDESDVHSPYVIILNGSY